MQDPMAMVAGLREIARLQGYYATERVNVDVNTGGGADMQCMSDADLLTIIAQGALAPENVQ